MVSRRWAWVLWGSDGLAASGWEVEGFFLGQWSAFLLLPPDAAASLGKTPGSVRPQVLLTAWKSFLAESPEPATQRSVSQALPASSLPASTEQQKPPWTAAPLILQILASA